MAKRLMKWTLTGAILAVFESGEEASPEALATFDLKEIYPDFDEYSDVQKQLIGYGGKQKLMDTGSSKVGDIAGKIEIAKDKWVELVDGKWSGTRINATGAAENRAIVDSLKKASEVVSLEGLLAKKALSGHKNCEPFTEEDQKKLTELLIAAAQAEMAANKKK